MPEVDGNGLNDGPLMVFLVLESFNLLSIFITRPISSWSQSKST